MITANRNAFTLLELIATVLIATAVVALGLRYLQTPGETSRQRSCDLTREVLQDYVDRYYEANGRWPSADLRELETSQYAGTVLPTCPATGDSYTRDRNGVVGCGTHEATR